VARPWKQLIVAVLVTIMASCSDARASDPEIVSVFAAASLSDVFTDVATAFEAQHPDRAVRFNFAGSSALREQLLDGAPAEVFVSANAANMVKIVDAGRAAGQPVVFASNRLVIAVPSDNPGAIRGITDFANVDLLLGVCAPAVPCGSYAEAAFVAAGIVPAIDTEEPDVRALLSKVREGELDGGIVYQTDALAARAEVLIIEIEDQPQRVDYQIIAMSYNEGAAAFVAFALSVEGQAILAEHGFGAP
jgi:molybdate transport system substrate-binding protein